jgi:hypothetical protein
MQGRLPLLFPGREGKLLPAGLCVFSESLSETETNLLRNGKALHNNGFQLPPSPSPQGRIMGFRAVFNLFLIQNAAVSQDTAPMAW